jgi:hypothetical protein
VGAARLIVARGCDNWSVCQWHNRFGSPKCLDGEVLLRRHGRGIAVCRLVSLNEPSSCTDEIRLWPGVAWRLRPLAPSSLRLRSCSND